TRWSPAGAPAASWRSTSPPGGSPRPTPRRSAGAPSSAATRTSTPPRSPRPGSPAASRRRAGPTGGRSRRRRSSTRPSASRSGICSSGRRRPGCTRCGWVRRRAEGRRLCVAAGPGTLDDVRQLIDTGWDSRAWIVDKTWLDREPRRPEVDRRLRAESELMRWLAPQLPLPVPEPRIVHDDPLRVRHRLLVGDPLDPDAVGPEVAAALGAFVRTLHDVPTADALRHGAMDATAAHDRLGAELDRMRSE